MEYEIHLMINVLSLFALGIIVVLHFTNSK